MDPATARLRACFHRVFPKLSDEQTLAARAGRLAEWDSVASITLLVLIEEEFGVAVDPGDFEEGLSFQGLLGRIQGSNMRDQVR